MLKFYYCILRIVYNVVQVKVTVPYLQKLPTPHQTQRLLRNYRFCETNTLYTVDTSHIIDIPIIDIVHHNIIHRKFMI